MHLALVVAVDAVGFRLNERRAACVARQFHRGRGRLPHGYSVIAVHHAARNVEGPGAIGDLPGGHRIRGGEFRIAVVFADQQQGQFPQGGDVQRLHEHALVGRAVAEEAHGNPPLAVQLRGEGRAGADGQAGADDAVGADDAFGEIGHVHGAAHAFADPGLKCIDFRQHGLRVAALGQVMAVAAVRAGNRVAVIQVRTHARGDGLLTDVQVYAAGQFAGMEIIPQPFLGAPDQHHGPVHGQHLPGIGFLSYRILRHQP